MKTKDIYFYFGFPIFDSTLVFPLENLNIFPFFCILFAHVLSFETLLGKLLSEKYHHMDQ